MTPEELHLKIVEHANEAARDYALRVVEIAEEDREEIIDATAGSLQGSVESMLLEMGADKAQIETGRETAVEAFLDELFRIERQRSA